MVRQYYNCDTVEDLLVNLTMQVYSGYYYGIKQLASEHKYRYTETGRTLTIHGVRDITISKHSDPPNIFLGLALAFLGENWKTLCPNGLKRVREKWRDTISGT